MLNACTTSFNKKSMWKVDKSFEESSTEYLDKKTSILKEMGVKEIVKDKSRQKQGIDLICDIPRTFPKSIFKFKERKVDIKSIAKVIPTFSFEISGNVSTGQLGWLINPDLQTDYYLIVYHEIKNGSGSYTTDKQNMTVDNIVYTKALLIKKDKLLKRIHQEFHQEFTQEYLSELIKEIRQLSSKNSDIKRYTINEEGKIKEREGAKNTNNSSSMYFTISNQLKEKPINIIIKRTILEEIAEKIWEVNEKC